MVHLSGSSENLMQGSISGPGLRTFCFRPGCIRHSATLPLRRNILAQETIMKHIWIWAMGWQAAPLFCGLSIQPSIIRCIGLANGMREEESRKLGGKGREQQSSMTVPLPGNILRKGSKSICFWRLKAASIHDF